MELPDWGIGDKACGGDGLDRELLAAGIELVALNRSDRRRPTRYGRRLRRHRRRWKVEILLRRCL